MTLTVSIVIYKNKAKDVQRALQSLAANNVKVKTYIIDNSPSPVNVNTDLLPGTCYWRSERNLGFGSAHNLILRQSINNGAKYHLVLNPDVSFSCSVIEKLYSYMESHPEVGNVMPKVCYPDGSNQYLAKQLPTPGKLLIRLFHPFLPSKLVHRINKDYELQDLPQEMPINVPSLSGCFMFLRVDALRWAGIFDERFFLYFEDFDLIRRISAGYKTVYFPQLMIKHRYLRASRRNLPAFASHVASGVKYFNKWGWFLDKNRRKANNKILRDIRKDRLYVSIHGV